MPKPQWDKKTISTYLTQEQKEVWEKTAKAERKALAHAGFRVNVFE